MGAILRCSLWLLQNLQQLLYVAGLEEYSSECPTTERGFEHSNMQRRFVTFLDSAPESEDSYDSQISPASVLPEPSRMPLKVHLAFEDSFTGLSA